MTSPDDRLATSSDEVPEPLPPAERSWGDAPASEQAPEEPTVWDAEEEAAWAEPAAEDEQAWAEPAGDQEWVPGPEEQAYDEQWAAEQAWAEEPAEQSAWDAEQPELQPLAEEAVAVQPVEAAAEHSWAEPVAPVEEGAGEAEPSEPGQPEADAQSVAAAPAAVPERDGVWLGVLVAVVAALAALAAVLGVLVVRSAGPSSLQTARDDALDAARNGARVIFSYDYRHLDKDFAAGRAATTGEFRSEYETTTGKIMSDVAPRYKAVVVADVGAAGVVSATQDQVVVLVFVDQQSTSTLTAQPKLTQSRLQMTMVRKDGRWLVQKIQAF